MSISWAQSILIDLGALLQIAALVALIRQRAGYRMLPRHGEQMRRIGHEMTPAPSGGDDPAHEYSAPPEPRQGRWQPGMRTGNLTKTSRVPFEQKFKFRQ
jgi:hypothetical protein